MRKFISVILIVVLTSCTEDIQVLTPEEVAQRIAETS